MSTPRLHHGGTWSVISRPSTGWEDEFDPPAPEYSVALDDEGRPIVPGDHAVVTRCDGTETEVEVRERLDAYTYHDMRGIERWAARYRFRHVPLQQRLWHPAPRRQPAFTNDFFL